MYVTDAQVMAQALGHRGAQGKFVYSITIPTGFFGTTLQHVVADNKREAAMYAREYAVRMLGWDGKGVIITRERATR